MTPTEDSAWGTPDAHGISFGLKVMAANPLSYRVSIANRSPVRREVTLFATLDGKIRTRLVAKQAGVEQERPAIMPPRPVTSNYAIKIELAPGEIIVREGQPVRFELSGEIMMHLVHGGVPAHPAEITSGEVAVTLAAVS
ncbi:MAG: hypothetical protein ABI867_26025 [Kofleriaceae bacterium]